MTRTEIIQSQETGGMYMVIPSVVMLDQELSLSAKMLYGVITWKCNQKAFCWLTNRSLGEALGLSQKRVSALLSDLERRGHIETEIIRDEETGQVLKRYIYPVVKSSKGLADPILKNKDTPPLESEDTCTQKNGEPIPENEEKENKKEKNKNNTPQKPPKGGRRGSRYDLAEDAKPLLQAYVAGDQELHRMLGEFIKLRVELQAINSREAIKRLLNRLDKLSGGDRGIKLQLLDQSITSSWKSVFPLRGKEGQQAQAAPPQRPAETRRWHTEVRDGEEVVVYD